MELVTAARWRPTLTESVEPERDPDRGADRNNCDSHADQIISRGMCGLHTLNSFTERTWIFVPAKGGTIGPAPGQAAFSNTASTKARNRFAIQPGAA